MSTYMAPKMHLDPSSRLYLNVKATARIPGRGTTTTTTTKGGHATQRRCCSRWLYRLCRHEPSRHLTATRVMTTAAAAPRARGPGPDSPASSGPELKAGIHAAAALTGARRGGSSVLPGPLSDKATSMLIRRTLCPQSLGDKGREAQQPIEELLPPLTSRNDVDFQLYALLAIIIKEFVQRWYSKITTDDTFVAETMHTIAHCTTALEQRFRKLDLESLVLDEIPDLLDKHVTGGVPYQAVHEKAADNWE